VIIGRERTFFVIKMLLINTLLYNMTAQWKEAYYRFSNLNNLWMKDVIKIYLKGFKNTYVHFFTCK